MKAPTDFGPDGLTEGSFHEFLMLVLVVVLVIGLIVTSCMMQ